MIALTKNTPDYGDCTAGYAVNLDKEYTVQEFINEVLTRREWGFIGIYNKGQAWYSPGNPNCEYKGSSLLTEMPSDVLSMKINSATASGGWSRMDYLLRV